MSASTPTPTTLITGGTGGIGYGSARRLATMGHRVILVGRDGERAAQAAAHIQDAGGEAIALTGDLATLAGVRSVAEAVQHHTDRLDGLAANVGAFPPDAARTTDGLLVAEAVNAVMPIALIRALQPQLAAAGGRVVAVSTGGVRMGGDQDDVEALAPHYHGFAGYTRSKRLGARALLALDRQLAIDAIRVDLADPGSADTAMTRGMGPELLPRILRPLHPALTTLQRRVVANDDQAPLSTVVALTDDGPAGGRWLRPNGRPGQLPRALRDRQRQDRALERVTQLLEGLLPAAARDRTDPRG